MFMLSDIHTYDSVHLNVYLPAISTLSILVNITDCCFIGWYRMKWLASPVLMFLYFKAVLQLLKRFFVFTCFQ